jgi:hypothetical protein
MRLFLLLFLIIEVKGCWWLKKRSEDDLDGKIAISESIRKVPY